jgi:predicted nuclease of restriction endonuclease-like (RecB) superfamily
MRQWYLFYNQQDKIVQQVIGQLPATTDFASQQLVTQIPWGHNILIIKECKIIEEALFYIHKTIENGWSRMLLDHHIGLNLYGREGKAITNFAKTLPAPQSELANQALKDPYVFDLMSLTEKYNELELEDALTENITKFLLELGAGFAYVGRQVPLNVGGKDYPIDLLFYHLKLRCYVVIDLKTVKFVPETAGKISFYLSAADDLLRYPTDNPTIGLIICKDKNNVVAEYALRNINQPIGISEYKLTRSFPEKFKGSLPTIKEIEDELNEISVTEDFSVVKQEGSGLHYNQ